jgi:hypothetical protein
MQLSAAIGLSCAWAVHSSEPTQEVIDLPHSILLVVRWYLSFLNIAKDSSGQANE